MQANNMVIEADPKDVQFLGTLSYEHLKTTLIKWLTGTNAGRKAIAIQVLINLGQPAVQFLLDAALAPDTEPKHRIKLLEAIEKTGQRLDAPQLFDLLTAAFRFRDPAAGCQILAWMARQQHGSAEATETANDDVLRN